MTEDLRISATFPGVQEHFRRLHEPAFGRPHRLLEPAATWDGSRVVMTGEVLDRLEGLPRTGVFAVEDGVLRPLTSGGASRAPRFSPDGRTLAFLSDRGEPGRFQLHLLEDARLGEARATPAVPGTVEYARWSPDGRCLLLGVAGLGADLAGGQGSGTIAAPKPEQPAWYPLIETRDQDEAWRTIWIYDLASDEVRRLTPRGLNAWEADWCGSARVLAVTSPLPGESAWYTAVLSLLDVSTSGLHELARSDVQLGWPAGSPTGARAAIVEAVCSDRGLVAGELLVLDVATGSRTSFETIGVDVTAFSWLDDDRISFLGVRGLDTAAGVLDVTTGDVRETWVSSYTCGLRYPEAAFLADGRLVVVAEGYRQPQQVRLVGEHRQDLLASIAHEGTDYLLGVAGRSEPVAWTAPDGLRIEGILCRPEGDGPFPLVVNVHGGPVWAYRDMWQLFYPITPLLVARGYAVLSPNPRGSSGRGQSFALRVQGDMGGADTDDLLSGIDALVDGGIADPTRVGVMGGSYGGFMSAWLVTQDARFAAAVCVAPISDWYSQHFTSNVPFFDALFLGGDPEVPGDRFHQRSPVLHASRVRTPCLNIAGALDRCTPPTQAREFHQALLEYGVDSELAVYPQEGHGVRAYPALIDYCARVLTWFDRFMPAGATRSLSSHTHSDAMESG